MIKNNQYWTRRKFIGKASMAGVTLSLTSFINLNRFDSEEKVKKIISKTIGIDTHNHMDMPYNTKEFDAKKYDLHNEMKTSGFTAICMTFSVDRPTLKNEGEAYERFLANLDEMDEVLKMLNLSKALNCSDIKKAKKEDKQIVIQSVEGGHFIEGKLERIKGAYDKGLRVLGLMHDGQTSPALGDIYTDEPQYGGLTQIGKEVIKECNRLGILIDLTHCSNQAINMALETSNKPMMISHTGLNTQLGTNEKMAKMMMPRLITKEQAKTFANAGGVVGIWTHLAESPLDFANNIRAMVDIIGSEHVCIGTDTKMAPSINNNEQYSRRTNQSWTDTKVGFLYSTIDAMLKIGFSEKEITQICGGNFCKIFEKATNI